jgi:hypothetical protein
MADEQRIEIAFLRLDSQQCVVIWGKKESLASVEKIKESLCRAFLKLEFQELPASELHPPLVETAAKWVIAATGPSAGTAGGQAFARVVIGEYIEEALREALQ